MTRAASCSARAARQSPPDFHRRLSGRAAIAAATAAAVVLLPGCGGGGDGAGEPSARAPWSIIEDHTPLIRSGVRRRELTLREMRDIGADTLRVAVKWSEVAPGASSGRRPEFDATD